MRLFYRKKMLENRHFLIGIFQHFTTVADISVVILYMLLYYLYNVYLNIIYFALAFALVQFTKVNHPLNNRIYRFIKEHKK